MVGVLKGHTGPVLDMNFSSNGRFLASCAEGMYRYSLKKFFLREVIISDICLIALALHFSYALKFLRD